MLHRPSYPGNGAGTPAVSAGSSSGRSTFSKASLYGSDEGEEGGQRKQRKSAGGFRHLGTAGSMCCAYELCAETPPASTWRGPLTAPPVHSTTCGAWHSRHQQAGCVPDHALPLTLPRPPAVDPATASLRLYCHELDQGRLWEVLEGLRLLDKVHIAAKVDQADAVLALRWGGWLGRQGAGVCWRVEAWQCSARRLVGGGCADAGQCGCLATCQRVRSAPIMLTHPLPCPPLLHPPQVQAQVQRSAAPGGP